MGRARRQSTLENKPMSGPQAGGFAASRPATRRPAGKDASFTHTFGSYCVLPSPTKRPKANGTGGRDRRDRDEQDGDDSGTRRTQPHAEPSAHLVNTYIYTICHDTFVTLNDASAFAPVAPPYARPRLGAALVRDNGQRGRRRPRYRALALHCAQRRAQGPRPGRQIYTIAAVGGREPSPQPVYDEGMRARRALTRKSALRFMVAGWWKSADAVTSTHR
eukprot:1429705-Prymnesium_polylepis.1